MKASTLTCFSLILALSSFCQKYPFTGGILLGGNVLEVVGDQEKKYSGLGFTAGVCVQRYVARKVPLQLELNYIQKGSLHPWLNGNGTINWEYLRLHYVELPLTASYQIGSGPNHFFLEAGTAMAYLFDVTYSESWAENLPKPPSKEHYREVDWSALAGVGYRTNLGAIEDLVILFRVSRSFLSVNKLVDQYNFLYGTSIYYYFPNSKKNGKV